MTGRPAGYGSVTPRLFVADPKAQVEFLRAVFGATGEVHPGRPTELRIGDSLVLVGSTAEREPFPAFLYIYVDDADATYQRALNAGAISVEEPLDTPYGDRRGTVRDRFGNVYQIAHRVDPTDQASGHPARAMRGGRRMPANQTWHEGRPPNVCAE